MTALLSVNDLHVSYGKIEAVTGVSRSTCRRARSSP